MSSNEPWDKKVSKGPWSWLSDPEVAKKLQSVLGTLAGFAVNNPRTLRYSHRWLQSMLPNHNPLVDRIPWMTFAAIDWLNDKVLSDMRVFEYGSGGSTLFFASRADHVTSIEHDQGFWRVVKHRMDELGLVNVDLRLVEPYVNSRSEQAIYSQTSKTSLSDGYRGYDFTHYVESINEFSDSTFDIVVVDGRARASCIFQAAPKLKSAGVLLLDNSERPQYGQAIRELVDRGWARKDFSGIGPCNSYEWTTTAFFKP